MDLFQRLKLRHLLFLTLLLSGIIPLAVSSFLLIRQNRDILETQEKTYLTRSARFLSQELSRYLATSRGRVEQLGDTVLMTPSEVGSVTERLRQDWLAERVGEFLLSNPNLSALRVLDDQGRGPQFVSEPPPQTVLAALDAVFQEVQTSNDPIYRFVIDPATSAPTAILAVPVRGPAGERLLVEAVLEVEPLESSFRSEAEGDVAVFVIDGSGAVVWSEGSSPGMDAALSRSTFVRDFVGFPINLTAQYDLDLGDESLKVLGRVSPVDEPGWGVVVQKPEATSFIAVKQMVAQTALSTAVLIFLALVVAALMARRLSQPIQQLTESTKKIAAGSFGKRVEIAGGGSEIGQLATDFNSMSINLGSYVDQLQKAAQANRELFIGSMRAFVAAIDAKDPYTRGHSERVAAHSRTIARRLGLGEELEHRIWVGALLHDVGKIGIDDRVLKKGGVLTDEEYEQMKLHPVIGAQIMSRIEQLKEMIPAIRWHHEAWNGRGYPDSLTGAQIPLMARIVGVADTFDAITTNRPYQRAYEPAFAVQKLKELAGKRFDAKVVTAFLQSFEAGEVQVRRTTAAATPDTPSPAAVGSS